MTKSGPQLNKKKSDVNICPLFSLKHLSVCQELFSKQKGFLEEELDYRKQALDQAYMVRTFV